MRYLIPSGLLIKPWIFEFFPELGDEARDPEPREVADNFVRYNPMGASAVLIALTGGHRADTNANGNTHREKCHAVTTWDY
jgi:hypothetical protein